MSSATGNAVSDDLPAVAPHAVTVYADWLLYEEQEQGTDSYPVRILVSRRFVRIDDNLDDGDFVLLDRSARVLFSVSREARTILVIDSKKVDAGLPPDIVLTEERSTDNQAPRVGGKAPLHVRFNANGALCYEAVVVPGLLGKVTAALTEYERLLGLRQLNGLDAVPAAMQTPCFLSRYVYAPARHLLEGLPVRVWDESGYWRALVDYGEDLPVSSGLFLLPDGYQQLRINN